MRRRPFPSLERLPPPPPFEVARTGGAALVVRPELRGWAEEAVRTKGSLHRFARESPGARPLGGRGTAYAVPGPRGGIVVRHGRRGGAVAPLLGDRYLRGPGLRPLRELEVSEAARRRGIETPELLAVVLYPAGIFYRADVASRLLPGARELADVVFGEATPPGEREAALRSAGRLAADLARAGIHHRDLNAGNVLILGAASRAAVVDLDRAAVVDLDRAAALAPGAPGAGARMLARLRRSLRKWEARTGRPLATAEWEALEAGFREAVDGMDRDG